MTLTVDNPILNSPYREPERYWLYDAAGIPFKSPSVSGARL